MIYSRDLELKYFIHLRPLKNETFCYLGPFSTLDPQALLSCMQPSWLRLKNMPTVSLQRRKTLLPNKCPDYDTNPSDDEAPVLELWEIWSTLTLPLLSGPLCPSEVVVLFRVPSLDQIELLVLIWRCPWCNSYCRRKWTRRLKFKSWTRMIAFYIALIPLGKV